MPICLSKQRIHLVLGLLAKDIANHSYVPNIPLTQALIPLSNNELSVRIKPRANGRNIVGQQLPTLLDVTCCVRLHTLLHVVGCCCVLLRKVWTGQTFQPTTPNISFVPWSPKRRTTMLDPFAQVFRTGLPTFWGPRTLITHGLQRLMGCILPTMHCRSQIC